MNYGSVCSGIEAASAAWEPLGWQPQWFAEIEPFPSAVLAHRWPHVPNHGDMTKLAGKILTGEIAAPDVLVGGTPCQAFSVAGMRGSLSDPRGNLTLVLVRLLDAIDFIRTRNGQPPCTLVWENVPGVLNTKDNAFGCFLGALSGSHEALQPTGKRWTNAGAVLGERREIAWRVLDAQFFGVPQRRRRVFLIASAGGVAPCEILFERTRESRDSQAGGKARQEIAGYVESSFGTYRRDTVAGTVKAAGGACQGGSETLIVSGRRIPNPSPVANTLDCEGSGNTNVLCIAGNTIGRAPHNGGNGGGISDGIGYTLTAADRHAVCYGPTVRRLTPTECERLQGFPDGHTQIPWRGKPAAECPDGPRYKAIGNSMPVPVMQWIGKRIERYMQQGKPK